MVLSEIGGAWLPITEVLSNFSSTTGPIPSTAMRGGGDFSVFYSFGVLFASEYGWLFDL